MGGSDLELHLTRLSKQSKFGEKLFKSPKFGIYHRTPLYQKLCWMVENYTLKSSEYKKKNRNASTNVEIH